MSNAADSTRLAFSREQNHAARIIWFKDIVNGLIAELEKDPCREASVAITTLETATMWAVKGFTREVDE